MLYPPNNSSDPSPDKTTFTCLRASRATKYNGTQDGSANGSSICHIIFGSFSIYSSGEMMYEDRKSTRLNSSHVAISYAVFCLKKKINKIGKGGLKCFGGIQYCLPPRLSRMVWRGTLMRIMENMLKSDVQRDKEGGENEVKCME